MGTRLCEPVLQTNLSPGKADDELTEPYLKGFEWPPAHPGWEDEMARVKEEDRAHTREKQWGSLIIHLSSVPETSNVGGGKKKKKNAE